MHRKIVYLESACLLVLKVSIYNKYMLWIWTRIYIHKVTWLSTKLYLHIILHAQRTYIGVHKLVLSAPFGMTTKTFCKDNDFVVQPQ